MKSKKNIRIILALLLLASYVNVFALNLVCNYGKLFSSNHSGHAHEHEHSNDHSHKKQDHGSHHEHGKANSDHEDDKDGGCCNEEAGKVFESVFITPDCAFSIDFSLISPTPTFFSFLLFNTDIIRNSISNYSLPPPKIPDIRVFIHSFQI